MGYMKHNIFISYSNNDKDIVENLRGRFESFGINAWVYSQDCTLGEENWKEIEKKIVDADIIIFVVSITTDKAKGQRKELNLACKHNKKIIPLFLNEAELSKCHKKLRDTKGLPLSIYNVESVAWKIGLKFFPSLVKKRFDDPWNYPRPGMWLQISHLDSSVEENGLKIGDKLYFHAISPMGLLECYAPKIKGLFWITPENVSRSLDIKNDIKLEKLIPKEFTVMGMTNIQALGWNCWHKSQELNK
jgi:hypothetical protein